MKASNIGPTELFATDLYILMEDIYSNFWTMGSKYHSWFYYTFNPHLPFLKSDGSYISQLKLMANLQAEGMVTYHEAEPPEDEETKKHYISENALKFPSSKMLIVEISPQNATAYNQDFAKNRRHYRSIIDVYTNPKQRSVTVPKIDKAGDLYIPGIEKPVYFDPQKNSYKLLRVILSNSESRLRVWWHNELEHDLDKPNDLKHPDNFVLDTANNINRVIAKKTNDKVKKLLDIHMSKEKESRTVTLVDRFM